MIGRLNSFLPIYIASEVERLARFLAMRPMLDNKLAHIRYLYYNMLTFRGMLNRFLLKLFTPHVCVIVVCHIMVLIPFCILNQ